MTNRGSACPPLPAERATEDAHHDAPAESARGSARHRAARRVTAAGAASLLACSGAPPSERPREGAPSSQATPQTSAGADGGAPADAATPDADNSLEPRARGASYRNPVVARDFPDPFVLREETAYYAFATNAAGSNVQASTSTDLVHWTVLPDALPNLPSWATAGASLVWAPSVLKRGSTFIMYYTANVTALGFQCISRAVATQPDGPYVDTSAAPLVCQTSGAEAFCGSIDPSPFVDVDGTPYLFWKSDENSPSCATPPRIWVQRLTDDGFALVGPRTAVLARTEAWEYPVIEGPSMVVDSGRYYLFYSANTYQSESYGVGYAVCERATGPCTKRTLDRTDGAPAALVHSTTAALGPGGQEFFVDFSGTAWMAYHAWTAPRMTYAGGGARSMRIDRITFVDGAPVFGGPTTDVEAL